MPVRGTCLLPYSFYVYAPVHIVFQGLYRSVSFLNPPREETESYSGVCFCLETETDVVEPHRWNMDGKGLIVLICRHISLNPELNPPCDAYWKKGRVCPPPYGKYTDGSKGLDPIFHRHYVADCAGSSLFLIEAGL